MIHYTMRIRLCAILFFASIFSLQTVESQSFTTNQESPKSYKNAVSLEMMGHGFAYTFSYERQLLNNSFFHTTAQIGFAYYGQNSDAVPLWIPITINQLTQIRTGEFFEIGAGKILRSHGPLFSDAQGVGGLEVEEWIMRLGYRYQHPERRMLFKIAYTPFLRPGEITHWCGLGWGVQF